MLYPLIVAPDAYCVQLECLFVVRRARSLGCRRSFPFSCLLACQLSVWQQQLELVGHTGGTRHGCPPLTRLSCDGEKLASLAMLVFCHKYSHVLRTLLRLCLSNNFEFNLEAQVPVCITDCSPPTPPSPRSNGARDGIPPMPEKMPANGGRRNVCCLPQGRVRPVQLVLRREAVRRVREGAQAKFATRAAPHGGRYWQCQVAEERRVKENGNHSCRMIGKRC